MRLSGSRPVDLILSVAVSAGHAGPSQGLTDGLIVTSVAVGQALQRPALAVQPGRLVKPICRDALPAQLYARAAKLCGHGRPMHVPTGGERLHVVTCLVLQDQFLGLLGSQHALGLSRLRDFGSRGTAPE